MGRIKKLVEQAVEYLSEAELLEENGWTKEDIDLLEFIQNNDFEIIFKGEKQSEIDKKR